MTSAKQLIVCLFGCLAMVAWAPDARSEEIPGFTFDGITGTGVTLDSRLGTSSGATDHAINIADCESYAGGYISLALTVDVSLGAFEYSVYVAEPGEACTETFATAQTGGCIDHTDSAETTTGSITISNIALESLTGSSCDTQTEAVAKVYVVARYADATIGTTVYVSTVDFTVDLEAPAAPVVTEVNGGDTLLAVTWTDEDNAAEATGLTYELCWAAGTSVGEASNCKDGLTATTYNIEDNIENGVSYGVTLRAIDVNGNEGPFSNTESGTPEPSLDYWEYYLAAGGQDTGGFCFIATATYGGAMASELGHLRAFRDQVLMPTSLGRSFVAGYYRWGRFAAAYIADKPVLKAVVRIMLVPLVWLAQLFTALGPFGAFCVLGMLGIALVGVRRRWLARIYVRTPVEVRS